MMLLLKVMQLQLIKRITFNTRPREIFATDNRIVFLGLFNLHKLNPFIAQNTIQAFL